jgi:hypothetical protein
VSATHVDCAICGIEDALILPITQADRLVGIEAVCVRCRLWAMRIRRNRPVALPMPYVCAL